MSQEEVIKILKKNKKPMSRSEIAEKLNCDPTRISRSLQRLIRYNEVKIIELNHKQAMKYYSYKKKMRIYYI